MNRLLRTIKTDVIVQWRNRLYSIGIGVGLIVAVGLSQLGRPDHMYLLVPVLMLIVVGGSTLMYVAGMIVFERDEGTLNAVIVSPLKTSEYLWSKIITLTGLATIEAVVMIGGAMLIMRLTGIPSWPNVPILLAGIIAIAIVYTLIGIVLIVRYDKLTDFLMPMAAVAVVLQLPFLHFLGVVVHPLFLIIPTSAQTMFMQGAYIPLSTWEWVYVIGYTLVLIASLSIWAYRAFDRYIVAKAG